MAFIVNELLGTLYFTIFLYVLFKEKLRVSRLKVLGIASLYIILLLFFLFLQQRESLIYMGTFMEMLITAVFLVERWYEKIFSFLLLFTMPNIVAIAIETLGRYLIGERHLAGFLSLNYGTIGYIISILIFSIFAYLRHKEKPPIYVSNSSKLLLFLVSSIFIAVLTSLAMQEHDIDEETSFLMSICSLVIVIICTWLLVVDSSRRIQRGKAEKVEQYMRYMKKLELSHTEIRKISHDINGHIHSIGVFAENGDLGKIRDYIGQMNMEISKRCEDKRYTDNLLFNGILTDKVEVAKSKGVKLAFRGMLGEDCVVNDYDLCIICSNLLDNAIEYTAKNHLKAIDISTFQDHNSIVIKVSNEICHGQLIDTNDSSKENRECHGFGLKNVEEAVEKYNGNLRITVNQDTFTAQVMIFL